MNESERTPDLDTDVETNDDVEILEVVGVEEDSERLPHEPDPSEDPGDLNEYVLDLDNPDDGGLADRVDPAAPAGSARSSDLTRLVRLRADYDNLRKRIDRERDEFELHANISLVGKLLPVLDNLDRALAVDASERSAAGLREGLVMIHKQLTDQLTEDGLQPIDAMGQPFDPNLHDAVATETTTSTPPNTVVEEFQTGYLFRNRVLRPALVRVTTPAEDPENATDESAES